MHDIIPIERITREAAKAARLHADVNAACPYPFGSTAGKLFKKEFQIERDRIAALTGPDPQERRPGVGRLAEKIAIENPGLSRADCAAQAKAAWTNQP